MTDNTAEKFTFHPDEIQPHEKLAKLEGVILIHDPKENRESVLKDLREADVHTLSVYEARGLLSRLKHLVTSEGEEKNGK